MCTFSWSLWEGNGPKPLWYDKCEMCSYPFPIPDISQEHQTKHEVPVQAAYHNRKEHKYLPMKSQVLEQIILLVYFGLLWHPWWWVSIFGNEESSWVKNKIKVIFYAYILCKILSVHTKGHRKVSRVMSRKISIHQILMMFISTPRTFRWLLLSLVWVYFY